MHRGPNSAAHVHPTPDEETGKTREKSGEGGGVGGGDIHRAVCDAVELSERRRAARGTLRGAVGSQRRAPGGGEDPQLVASPSVRHSCLCVLFRRFEASEGSSTEERA